MAPVRRADEDSAGGEPGTWNLTAAGGTAAGAATPGNSPDLPHVE